MKDTLPFEQELKHCPRCDLWLPPAEFGVCNARPDKMNLYDRKCIREKIYAGRQALREYKAAHSTKTLSASQLLRKPGLSRRSTTRLLHRLRPIDRVLEAVRSGAKTHKEIVRASRLPRHDVSDYIAELMLDRREIRTEERDGVRMYFVVDENMPIRKPNVRSPHEPRSYGVSNIYSCGYWAA